MRGPLVVVGDSADVGWDDSATIEVAGGAERHGLVLEVDRGIATVQVLEGTDGMTPGGVQIRFAGRPMEIPVSATGSVGSATGAETRWMADRRSPARSSLPSTAGR
ncbi:MAG: hypothetical protein WDM88_06105 [Galbitalea sp.]